MCYIKLSYSLNIYHNLVKKYLTITRSKHLNKIENILPRKMCIVKPSKHHISSDKRINYSTFSYISRRILLFTMGASLQWNFFEKGVIYSCMILKYKSFFTAVFYFFFFSSFENGFPTDVEREELRGNFHSKEYPICFL